MDVDQLTREAEQLSQDLFTQRYPHLFFLFYAEKEGTSQAQFRTEVASRATQSMLAGVLRVLPLVKAPSNPYTDRISIGRARNCDVVLRHPSVSKLHAHLRHESDATWMLHDTGSHNGTSVGKEAVTPTHPVRLHSGDLVTFGAVTVRVVDSAELHLVLTRLLRAVRPW